MKRLFFFMYDGNDIYNAFKLSSVANSYFTAWASGKVTLDFSDKYKELSDLKKLSHLKTFSERCFFGVPVSQWNEWAIKGMSNPELKAIGFSHHTITTVRALLFEGQYAKKQIELRKMRTLSCLQKGLSFEDIYVNEFRYSLNYIKAVYTLRRYFTETLFPGLLLEEIMEIAFEQSEG